MLKNYIKIAWRNLVKEKSFTAINLLGLSLAFAASIMLFLTADFHFSYDDTHVNKNSIYKLYHKVNRPTGVEYSATMAPPVAPTLVAEYPEEIAAVSRMMDSGMLVEYKGKTYELDINYVDPSYFDIFTFTVTQGDKQAPLGDLNNIILREKDAKRIFGNEDPIGKVVLRWNESEKKPLTVSAVLADGPENSTIESSNLARFEIYGSYQEAKDEWSWQNHDVYLLLNPNI